MTLIGLSLVSLVSCTKEENVAAPTQKVDVNRVVFASIAEYENLFVDPNSTTEKVNNVAERFSTFNEATVDSALEDIYTQSFCRKF